MIHHDGVAVLRGHFPAVPNPLTWWLLLVMGTITFGLGLAQGFTLKLGTLANALVLTPGLLAMALFYTRWRPNPKISITFMLLVFVLAKALVLAPMSYVATAWNLPLVDDYFAAFDAALGFDWVAVHKFTASIHWFATVSKFAYLTCGYVMFLAWAVLVWTGQHERLSVMLLALLTSGFVTVVLSGLIPGEAAYAYYGIKPEQYGYLGTVPGQVFVHDFYALRDGSLRMIDMGSLEGICTFPSFHAVVAVITGWAFAATRWLRWPAGIFSAFVLFVTLPVGGHYLADVVGGAAIAALCIALAWRYELRGQRQHASALMPLAPEGT